MGCQHLVRAAGRVVGVGLDAGVILRHRGPWGAEGPTPGACSGSQRVTTRVTLSLSSTLIFSSPHLFSLPAVRSYRAPVPLPSRLLYRDRNCTTAFRNQQRLRATWDRSKLHGEWGGRTYEQKRPYGEVRIDRTGVVCAAPLDHLIMAAEPKR